jgi:NifB/MoaA-like Fe-S oxidoreductase
VGVSAFSEEATMRPHTPAEAGVVIDLAESIGALTRELLGRTTVYASDEFYLAAGRPTPGPEHYESLDQAENGVGMVAEFTRGFVERLETDRLGTGFFQSVDGAPAWGYRAERGSSPEVAGDGPLTVLTGEYAAPLLRELFDTHGFDDVDVVAVANTFFGGNIKVAGLLTGEDLARALHTIDPAAVCLVPDVCLNEGRFLDGSSLSDLPRAVTTVRTTGRDLRHALEARRMTVASVS